jgi:hypothetical protein
MRKGCAEDREGAGSRQTGTWSPGSRIGCVWNLYKVCLTDTQEDAVQGPLQPQPSLADAKATRADYSN